MGSEVVAVAAPQMAVQTTTAAVVQSAFSSKALTADQMNILRTQIAPDITDNDLLYCLEVADACQLNPILKDIYFVPRQAQINGRWIQKHEPMVGRRGARAIARRKGMVIPPNTGHTIKKFPKLVQGEWTEERDLVGWAELVIDGQVVRKEAAYSVFKQTKRDGTVSKFWNDMPTVMCEKVAEFQLLDAVYGLDGVLSMDAGIVSEDEPIISEVIPTNQEDIINALKSLGMNHRFEEDLLIVEGSQMQNSKTLKSMGFGFYNDNWQIRVKQEEVPAEAPAPKKPSKVSPAKELLEFLLSNGLDNDSAGKFVKDVLGLSSKDAEGCALALENKDIILEQIGQYLAQQEGSTLFS